MAILPLVLTPNPLLKIRSDEVDEINDDIRKLMDDMLETMYHENGAGIAAVQVGVLKRIFIVDVSKKDNKDIRDPYFLVNPEITVYSEEKILYPEGCLSFPGGMIDVERPRTIVLKYLDYHGKAQQKEFTDWFARAAQHELDHLNGITLPDRLSAIKRTMLLSKVKKYKKSNNIA